MLKVNKRFSSLDGMKAIAAFLVICIHIPIPGTAGQITVALARIAVPFFFMVSGFFASTNLEKIKASSYKVLELVILANVLYFVSYYLFSVISTGNLLEYIQTTFTIPNLIKTLFFNHSPIAGHLWYLNAYFYVLIIYYFAVKYKIVEKLYWLIPVLLLGDLILGTYSNIFLGVEVPYIFVRNFVFVGIPYYLLGNYLSGKGMKIIKSPIVTNDKTTLTILIFSLATLLERYLLRHFDVVALREHYFSTTILTLSIFIYLIINNDLFSNSFLSEIGKKYSTYIYIFHQLIIDVYRVIVEVLDLESLSFIAPIIVMIVSVFVSVKYVKFRKNYTLLRTEK